MLGFVLFKSFGLSHLITNDVTNNSVSVETNNNIRIHARPVSALAAEMLET